MIYPNRLAYYAKRPFEVCHLSRLAFGIIGICQSYATVKPLQDKGLQPFDIYKNNIYIPFIRVLSYLNSHFAGLTYFNNFRIKKSIYIRGDRDKCQTPLFEPPW